MRESHCQRGGTLSSAQATAVTMRDLCPALQNKTYFNQDTLAFRETQIACKAMAFREEQ